MGIFDPPGQGSFGGQTHSQDMQLQIAAATGRIETRSGSAFYQITLCLFSIFVTCMLCVIFILVIMIIIKFQHC